MNLHKAACKNKLDNFPSNLLIDFCFQNRSDFLRAPSINFDRKSIGLVRLNSPRLSTPNSLSII